MASAFPGVSGNAFRLQRHAARTAAIGRVARSGGRVTLPDAAHPFRPPAVAPAGVGGPRVPGQSSIPRPGSAAVRAGAVALGVGSKTGLRPFGSNGRRAQARVRPGRTAPARGHRPVSPRPDRRHADGVRADVDLDASATRHTAGQGFSCCRKIVDVMTRGRRHRPSRRRVPGHRRRTGRRRISAPCRSSTTSGASWASSRRRTCCAPRWRRPGHPPRARAAPSDEPAHQGRGAHRARPDDRARGERGTTARTLRGARLMDRHHVKRLPVTDAGVSPGGHRQPLRPAAHLPAPGPGDRAEIEHDVLAHARAGWSPARSRWTYTTRSCACPATSTTAASSTSWCGCAGRSTVSRVVARHHLRLRRQSPQARPGALHPPPHPAAEEAPVFHATGDRPHPKRAPGPVLTFAGGHLRIGHPPVRGRPTARAFWLVEGGTVCQGPPSSRRHAATVETLGTV